MNAVDARREVILQCIIENNTANLIPMTERNITSYEIVDFDALPATACPCGYARRAFLETSDFPGTIHRTEITTAAKTHFHRRLTETYYILQCEADARMELDGQIISLRPGLCILIRPGVRHRAIGRMTVLIVVFPKFHPSDEVLVEREEIP